MRHAPSCFKKVIQVKGALSLTVPDCKNPDRAIFGKRLERESMCVREWVCATPCVYEYVYVPHGVCVCVERDTKKKL